MFLSKPIPERVNTVYKIQPVTVMTTFYWVRLVPNNVPFAFHIHHLSWCHLANLPLPHFKEKEGEVHAAHGPLHLHSAGARPLKSSFKPLLLPLVPTSFK